MAKARSKQKRETNDSAQPALPGTREPARSGAKRLLPMQLMIGDRFSDEAGEWEVASRPHTTAGGKVAHVRVRRVDQPAIVEERTWGAHERLEVRRG